MEECRCIRDCAGPSERSTSVLDTGLRCSCKGSATENVLVVALMTVLGVFVISVKVRSSVKVR